jgi:hypothetical protein
MGESAMLSRQSQIATPFQFGLRGLLFVTAIACVTAATWRALGWPAVFVALTALMISIACWRCDGGERRRRATWGALLGSAVFTHAVLCRFAYESLGGLPSLFLHAALVLYWPAAVIYMAGRHRSGMDVALVLAMLFVPPQAIWAVRLAVLRDEVAAIIDFGETVRVQSGQYPEHLDQYDWSSPELQQYVEYSHGPGDNMIIYFRPSAFSEPHWYSTTSGWGFSPD